MSKRTIDHSGRDVPRNLQDSGVATYVMAKDKLTRINKRWLLLENDRTRVRQLISIRHIDSIVSAGKYNETDVTALFLGTEMPIQIEIPFADVASIVIGNNGIGSETQQ
jgi:hypothetical protein